MRLASLAAVAALVLCGIAAGGTAPGRNGSIVFSRTSSDPDGSLVDLDPSSGSQHTLGPGAEPAFSPDGSKLAFVRGGVVQVASADGTGGVAVGDGRFPAWSPDGTHLVVSRADGKGVLQLVVLDLGGGPASQLTDGAGDAILPAWSPDGATIAFLSGGSLLTVPAAGGAPTMLALPVAVAGGPSWAPDGHALAFLDPAGQVWAAAPDGGAAHQVTYTLVGPASTAPARPAWSPDGGAIAWAANADVCVTTLGGDVARLTRTPQSAGTVVASLPDWRSAPSGSGSIVAAPPGANDSTGCDWNPGVRVEMLEGNLSPSIVAVDTAKQLVFVNHLTRPLTVSTAMGNAHATVDAGRFAAFPTQPGTYDFTVTGYPDGVPRRGTVIVKAAGRVSIEQHAAIRYGTSTVITGVAASATGGPLTVKARPFGASAARTVATVTPSGGRWRLSVAPSITTRYLVSYQGATADRLLRVKPDLRVSRSGRTLRIALRPASQLAGKTVFVFRLGPNDWTQVRSARVGGNGVAMVRNLPPGRYYVGFEGGADFWGTATDPFTIRR